MTEYDYYHQYSEDVEARLEEVRDKIAEGVAGVVDTFNDAIGSKGWMWLVSPAVKIAFEMARDRIEHEIERLWEEFTRACDDMWDKVEEMTGNPWTLMEMNQSYLQAAGRLRDEKVVIGDLTSEVSKHWSGVAQAAYSHAAGRQVQALDAVDSGLVAAATACAEGALQIRSIWRDMVDAVLEAVNTVLDAIKDGTDAGQWVTFDAGPAIKVVGKIAVTALQLWNDLDRYFDENATVQLSMWRNLNGGLDGLDANNDWPGLGSRDEHDMDGPGGWTRP